MRPTSVKLLKWSATAICAVIWVAVALTILDTHPFAADMMNLAAAGFLCWLCIED